MSKVVAEAQTSPSTPSSLRPVRDVAEFLALSRSKVYQLMESGELPYVKFGKSRRVRWSDVLELIESSVISRG